MKKGLFYIMLTTVLFSTMEIALKTITGVFNPIQLTFTRFFIGGLVLLPVALYTLRKRGLKIPLDAWVYFSFLGFLGVVASMSFYQLSVGYIPASASAVIFSCNPVFVTLFAFLIIKEEIRWNHIAALILEIAGIVVLVNPFQVQISTTGVILMVLAAVFFALYGVMGKKQCQTFSGVVVTCFSFLFGSIEMMMLSLLTHLPSVSRLMAGLGLRDFVSIPFFTGYTADNLWTILYICVGVTGIGYVSYFMAMEKTSANTASLSFFFKPALAPVLAFLILHEAIPFNMILGILMILAGSLISLLPGLLAATASLPQKSGQ